MGKIYVPGDRTDKQPVRAYCLNPQCLERSEDGRFEFEAEADPVACPKCGADGPPLLGLLVLIHLLVADPHGPIAGSGMRYRLACDERRAYLATATNLEAATGVPSVANCPACLMRAHELKLSASQGRPAPLT